MASQAVITTDQPRSDNALVQLKRDLDKGADQFKMVLPSHIGVDKFQRTILTAVQSDPGLLEADRRTFLTACMKAAQDGLLPDKREAALVIYTVRKKGDDGQWRGFKEVQYLPMVYGLRKKILQSGEIKDITAKVVYRREAEEGLFVYEEGTEAVLRHRPLLDIQEAEAGDDMIVAAYSMATFEDGSKSYEVMRRFEIDKVRQASQSGALGKTDRQGNPIPPKGPWVDWYAEMAKKTVMRRHAKTLPMSGDIFTDVEASDHDLHARSATAVLSAVESAPPARIERHDPETGEVQDEIDPDAQAEADRAAYRAMDGQGDPESEPEEQKAEPEPAQEERVKPEPQREQEIEPDPIEALCDGIINRCVRAEIIGDVLSAENDWNKHKDAIEDVRKVFLVDQKIKEAKGRFGR